MKHRKKGKKFGREKKQRVALMRGLAVALIAHDRITTTEAKAKALRPFIEKIVTKGKTDGLAANRQLRQILPPRSVSRLLKDIVPRYIERAGGYTRIHKLAPRISDGAYMALIEFIMPSA